MPLIDALRSDPADDAQTVTLEQWSTQHGYDRHTHTYLPTANTARALPHAHDPDEAA